MFIFSLVGFVLRLIVGTVRRLVLPAVAVGIGAAAGVVVEDKLRQRATG